MCCCGYFHATMTWLSNFNREFIVLKAQNIYYKISFIEKSPSFAFKRKYLVIVLYKSVY